MSDTPKPVMLLKYVAAECKGICGVADHSLDCSRVYYLGSRIEVPTAPDIMYAYSIENGARGIITQPSRASLFFM